MQARRPINLILIIPIMISAILHGEEPGGNLTSYSFSGAVGRYEDFQHELPEGLLFTLEFIDYGPEGWAVRIFDPHYPSDNFCSVVTPPYRGINALQIYAWHFFNEEGTLPNDGSVNAPGEERRFYFVTSKTDFDAAFEFLSAMLWPDNPEDQEAAAAAHDIIHRERGVLVITELVPEYTEGDSVHIERLEFDVELFIPEFTPDSCPPSTI